MLPSRLFITRASFLVRMHQNLIPCVRYALDLSGQVQKGIVLSYLLSGGHGHGEPWLLLSQFGTWLSISRCKTTSSLLSSQPSPSALGPEGLLVFHTAPPLTSAGTWERGPSPSHFLYHQNTTAEGTAEILVSVFAPSAVPFPESEGGGGKGGVSCSLQSHTVLLRSQIPAPEIHPLPFALASIHMPSPHSNPHPPGRGFSRHSPPGGGRRERGPPAGQGARNAPAAPSGPGHGRAEGLPPPTLLLRQGWTTAEGPPAALQRQAGPTREELRPQAQLQAHGTVAQLQQKAQRCHTRIAQADLGKPSLGLLQATQPRVQTP